MDIFELVDNEKFFNPLSSRNRKIYFECIIQLIEKSKEIPVLYDSDARNCVAVYLKNSEYIYQNESGDVTENVQAPERNASVIMGYLRECGWITPREIGRNGENVANVPTNCRKIIDFLRKMSEGDKEGSLSNHISSMYEILKLGFEEDSVRAVRPYFSILKPLMDHVVELKNELLDLKDSIAGILRMVMEFQDVNSVGKFLMKDEVLERFFNDYFFIKNNGLIPSLLSFIKNKLRSIEEGSICSKIVADAAAHLQLDVQQAKEKVEEYFSGIQYFLTVEYEENMELIDMRINTYYNLANTRMMLVLGNGVNLESALDSFLSKIKDMEEPEKELVLEKLQDCIQICSQKYISRKSYEKNRRKVQEDTSIGLEFEEISEAEKEKRTQEIMNSTKNRFSVDSVRTFIEERFYGGKEIEVKEQKIHSREEAMMFAASVMYSGMEEFPYIVELKEDFVETEVATITNMRIRKK